MPTRCCSDAATRRLLRKGMLPRSVAFESWARCWRGVLKRWRGQKEEPQEQGEVEEAFLTPQALPTPDFGTIERRYAGSLTWASRKDWWAWADDLV